MSTGTPSTTNLITGEQDSVVQGVDGRKVTLPFPQAIAGRAVTLVTRQLRQIYTYFRQQPKGSITTSELYLAGELVLQTEFEALKTQVQNYFLRHRLPYQPNFDSALVLSFSGILEYWRKLVGDLQKSRSEELLFTVDTKTKPSLTTKFEPVDFAVLGLGGFWLTAQGLLTRVNLLSQDFVYTTLNTATVGVAKENDVCALWWRTEEDLLVCSRCEAYGHGGNLGHGMYSLDALPLELPPFHPHCRCDWEIIIVTN